MDVIREKYVPELVTLPVVPWVRCESKDMAGCLTPLIPDAPWRPLEWDTLRRGPTKDGVETREVGAGRQPVGGACTLRTSDLVF